MSTSAAATLRTCAADGNPVRAAAVVRLMVRRRWTAPDGSAVTERTTTGPAVVVGLLAVVGLPPGLGPRPGASTPIALIASTATARAAQRRGGVSGGTGSSAVMSVSSNTVRELDACLHRSCLANL
jgi:hypothetical protein